MNKSIFIHERTLFVLSILAIFAIALDYGYPDNYWDHLLTDIYYIAFGLFTFLYLWLTQFKGENKKIEVRKYILLFFTLVISVLSITNIVNFTVFSSAKLNTATASGIFLLAFFEISSRLFVLDKQTLHPALVFGLSFVILILIGSILLMLPNATNNGIDFIDALFTSASAVCVTGLVVLDTGKDFTQAGQIAILILIQFGALGMLSFTSLFALMFKGFGSYQTRLNLKNMINAETLGDTFKTLVQIVAFVFAIEAVGAALIYNTVSDSKYALENPWFFAIFHSISAFCNAGFSTLTDSLYEGGFRFNYNLHMIIAILIVLGGIGYAVILNVYHYFKKYFIYKTQRLISASNKAQIRIKPHLSLNTKIVLVTSGVLIVAGSLVFYFLEMSNTMAEHSQEGRFAIALFSSITCRTAGFNVVDTSAIGMPTVMIVLLLMWIGASPGSTGGGIKTTTFAVATLNILQQVIGWRNIKVGWKRVQQSALNRATAIISLSLIMVGLSTFLLTVFDSHLGLMQLAFESFSAYSTVGLSMGITSQLSTASKLVIIFTMFIGRVGFLTLLTGVIRQVYTYRPAPMEYPEEEIFIN